MDAATMEVSKDQALGIAIGLLLEENKPTLRPQELCALVYNVCVELKCTREVLPIELISLYHGARQYLGKPRSDYYVECFTTAKLIASLENAREG